MASKKKATPKDAAVTAAVKAASKKGVNVLGINPRDMTTEQRRELFAAHKKTTTKDWKVVQPNQEIELTPFDILALDQGLRLYGMAGRGNVYHVHGDESAGKSTLTYAIACNFQQQTGEPVAIYDFERTTQSWYLRAMGVDEDMAHVRQPDSIEEAIQDAVDLMNKGVRLFIFDSIPRMHSLVSYEDILDGSAFKVQPGTHARAISKFYEIMLGHIARVNGTLIMVNQTRSRIEMTREAGFAAKGMDTVTNLNYVLPGGRTNRFAAGVMIELKLKKAWRPGKHTDEWLMEPAALNGEEYIAHEVRLRSLKNKITGTGFRESTFWLRPGKGSDENISVRQYARELKMIAYEGGKWFVGNSLDEAIVVYNSKAEGIKDLVIDSNPEIIGKLKEQVIARLQADPTIGRFEMDDDTQRYLAGEDNAEGDDLNPKAKAEVPFVMADGVDTL